MLVFSIFLSNLSATRDAVEGRLEKMMGTLLEGKPVTVYKIKASKCGERQQRPFEEIVDHIMPKEVI